MKELEALEWLYNNKTWLNNNKVPEVVYETLKKALTPPTQEEVCAKLSEYLGEEVIYVANEFVYMKRITTFGIYGYKINIYLPPHLITLIGKFYEGLEE